MLAHATEQGRPVALSARGRQIAVAPTRESVASRQYPLTRSVFMVLNTDAAHPLSTATVEFLRYVLSSQGQAAMRREGNYLPLPHEVATHQRKMLALVP